jgi:sortase A
MNKVKISGGTRSLITLLSLAFMVLGIGCISYAIFNIWSQSGYSSNSNNPNITLVVDKLKGNSTTTVGTNSSNVLPEPIKISYSVYPGEGDNIGSLTIPMLNRKLPIIQGTSAKQLKKGVGHFTESVLPGEEDNCVISGHRDTAFRGIGKLKLGDEIIVQTSAGTFTYEVNGTKIVNEDDKTVIVPMDHAVLTLTTCYPFNVIGSANDRYIVSAVLVKSE